MVRRLPKKIQHYEKQFQQLEGYAWHYIFLHMVRVNIHYAFHIVLGHQQSTVSFKIPVLLCGIVWIKFTFDLPVQQMTGKESLKIFLIFETVAYFKIQPWEVFFQWENEFTSPRCNWWMFLTWRVALFLVRWRGVSTATMVITSIPWARINWGTNVSRAPWRTHLVYWHLDGEFFFNLYKLALKKLIWS